MMCLRVCVVRWSKVRTIESFFVEFKVYNIDGVSGTRLMNFWSKERGHEH